MPRRVDTPPNPWESTHVEYLGEPPPVALTVFEEQARSIVSSNSSPDVPFTHSANPYRGCFHGCAYCYARPSHQYLGFGAGTDFERKLVVKTNAVELLRKTFMARRWKGEALAMSGVTDCYQPLEASYGLTRGMLEVCLEFRNPVGVITKGALVERDVDLFAALHRVTSVRAYMSIPFADDAMGRAIEPYAASVGRRFAALRTLSEAGVTTGVSISPVIPGLNDDQIPEILRRAREAGAQRAFMVMLRLPAEVRPVFLERLQQTLPLRASKVVHAIEQSRGGELYDPRFGHRMKGQGPRWAAIEALFGAHHRRLGFLDDRQQLQDQPTTFARPRAQQELFDL
ncbi:MAG: PA0069 family radical SAM protein [Deltaproteobacteria bacterium]|nr:PA0069 family radical SAM protein [Deltaproteobacteria bacterium]